MRLTDRLSTLALDSARLVLKAKFCCQVHDDDDDDNDDNGDDDHDDHDEAGDSDDGGGDLT